MCLRRCPVLFTIFQARFKIRRIGMKSKKLLAVFLGALVVFALSLPVLAQDTTQSTTTTTKAGRPQTQTTQTTESTTKYKHHHKKVKKEKETTTTTTTPREHSETTTTTPTPHQKFGEVVAKCT